MLPSSVITSRNPVKVPSVVSSRQCVRCVGSSHEDTSLCVEAPTLVWNSHHDPNLEFETVFGVSEAHTNTRACTSKHRLRCVGNSHNVLNLEFGTVFGGSDADSKTRVCSLRHRVWCLGYLHKDVSVVLDTMFGVLDGHIKTQVQSSEHSVRCVGWS